MTRLFKPVFALFFILALAFTLAAAPAFAKQQKKFKYHWKFATLAPDGMGWSKHMKSVIFPVMKSFTRNELSVKVYWGGIMGDEEDYIRKIHIGQLQGAGLSAQGTVMVCPEMAVLELPFLFRNYLEVDYVRLKMDLYFDNLFKKKDLFLVGWVDQDFDQIYSFKYPMNKLEHFAKSRFVTWYGPMEEEMLEILDAGIVPVNVPEVAPAAQQGLVDAAIGPAIMVIGTQMHNKVKYVNPVKIRYSPATIIMTNKALNELPEEYRKDFYRQRIELGWRYSNLARQDNVKYLNSLIRYGIEKTEMTPEELKALKDRTMKVWPIMTGRLFSKELLDEVSSHINDFRAGKRLGEEDLFRFARMDPATISDKEKEDLRKILVNGLKEFGYDDGRLIKLDYMDSH